MHDVIAIADTVSYMYPRSPEPVLKDVSLTVYKGEFLGLIGPTGAGKTTLCLTFNGIVPQFYGGRLFGSIKIADLDTLEHPVSVLARHIGAVFEDPETQLIATSVENEIAFALENLCIPREEIIRRIPKALSAVRLEGTELKHPHELSGGQKQRLAIAAALALQPDLLILDEPTSQLDPIGTEEVFATVRELNKELGVTIVMVSHAAEEMAQYADRIALLSRGELVSTGTPDQIYADLNLLQQHALRPPEVARTFHQIKQTGIPINNIPVRLNEGINSLRSIAERNSITTPHIAEETATGKGDALLSVKDLKHTYEDGTEAIHGISLDIRENEYVLIIGQNGAGKSTLVKHFLKLLLPTEGTVTVGGVDTHELAVSDLARRIGYIAQNPDNQIFNTSVAGEVAFALRNLEHPEEEVETRTTESLKAMGLLDYREAHPLSLPKGDRARVVIAAILAMEPEIIIFDEPTTGQDYRGAQYILDISRQLHQMGKTVIVITHHLYLMPDYAERVIVMGKGTLLLDAPIRQAYHQVDLLQSTYLTPPQPVLLSQELSRQNGLNLPLLSAQELADCFKAEQSVSSSQAPASAKGEEL